VRAYQNLRNFDAADEIAWCERSRVDSLGMRSSDGLGFTAVRLGRFDAVEVM
jgi:hypothetical protein